MPGSCVTVSPAAIQGQEHSLETASNRASMNFEDKLFLSWSARAGKAHCLSLLSAAFVLLHAVCLQ